MIGLIPLPLPSINFSWLWLVYSYSNLSHSLALQIIQAPPQARISLQRMINKWGDVWWWSPSSLPLSCSIAVQEQEICVGTTQPLCSSVTTTNVTSMGTPSSRFLPFQSVPVPLWDLPARVASGDAFLALSHTCCEKHRYLIQNWLEGFAHILICCCPNGIKVSNCFISHGCLIINMLKIVKYSDTTARTIKEFILTFLPV